MSGQDDVTTQVGKRALVGCAVPLVMVVVGTIGAFALIPLGHAMGLESVRARDYGQGVGIFLLIFWIATPFFGLLAAAFPRTGIALGSLFLLGFLALNVVGMLGG